MGLDLFYHQLYRLFQLRADCIPTRVRRRRSKINWSTNPTPFVTEHVFDLGCRTPPKPGRYSIAQLVGVARFVDEPHDLPMPILRSVVAGGHTFVVSHFGQGWILGQQRFELVPYCPIRQP